MSRFKRIPVFLLAGLGAVFFAFQVPVFSPLVQQELDKRLEEYRQDQWRVCKKRALEKASLEVDSLVIIWAKANRDTLDRPSRPDKPQAPERLMPKDSTPVAPLFNGKDTMGD
ncbi:MAG: hypothetical protein IPL49_07020 [Saprospirales bacterium]|nr:hypothetical protein [Saprospirales bacterium]